MQTDNPGLSGDSVSAVLHESAGPWGISHRWRGLPWPGEQWRLQFGMALAYANSYLGMNLQLTTADTFSP